MKASLNRPLLPSEQPSAKHERASRLISRASTLMTIGGASTFINIGGPQAVPIPLAAAMILGHLAAQSLLYHRAKPAMALLAAVAVSCFVALLPRVHARGRCGRCVRRTLRAIRWLLTFMSHLIAPTWFAVGLLMEDPDQEMKSVVGVFLVSGPRLPWWESLPSVLLWLGLLILRGEDPQEICIWVPALLYVLGLVNGSAQSREGTDGLDRDQDSEEGTGSTEVEELNRCMLALKAAVRSLPDWAPPTQKEVKAWRGHFDLNEELLGVYVCSVRAGMTHQGRLYISLGHVCFHDMAIFKHALHFSLPLDQLSELRYGGSPKDAVLVLKQPLQLKGLPQVVLIELRDCDRGLQALEAYIRRGSKAASDHDDSDDEGTYSDAESNDTGRAKGLSDRKTLVFEDSSSGGQFNKLIEAHVPRLPLADVLEELLSDEWGENTLFRYYLANLGASDMRISPWADESDGGPTVKVREITMRMPCTPAPMCPKATSMTMILRLTVNSRDPYSFIVETSVAAHDVPMGSNFLVQERVTYDACDGDAAQIVKYCRVVFVKSCGLLNGRIQSVAMSEQTRTGDIFFRILRERSPQSPQADPSDGEGGSAEATCVVTVWELQRRTTLFHSDWRAPFLPHDGGKRWRWVDDNFHKHHGITCHQREDAAMADMPPLGWDSSWQRTDDWVVQRGTVDNNPTDDQGWQYSIDFYRNGVAWLPGGRGFHCRRRLWSCTFVPAAAPPPSPATATYQARANRSPLERREAAARARSGRSPVERREEHGQRLVGSPRGIVEAEQRTPEPGAKPRHEPRSQRASPAAPSPDSVASRDSRSASKEKPVLVPVPRNSPTPSMRSVLPARS